MSFMVWSYEMETGIDIVDRQHRGLVDMLNRAAPVLAQASQESLQEARPLLDGLLDYAATHFRTEEEMMARLGMDPRARVHHHASHAQFAAQVSDMVKAFSQGAGVTGDRILSFLASWLVLHILGEDQAMARQLCALEAGMPAEEAYATARGDELHPAPSALSNALVGIYTVLTRQNRELLLANRDLDSSRAQIQHHNENLEQLVRQRTAELEQLAENLRAARDAAEVASRAKTRFLGTMSHELRTPLNAILGFSRLLHAQGLPSQQDALARRIVGASDRLLELLNGIIDYSRLEGGGSQEVRAQSFELVPLLNTACAASFTAARKKGLATALEYDPALPARLLGDAGLIQRILGQFIGNAVKFTENGMIRVKVNKLSDESDGRLHVRFSVIDTGIGMPSEAQARLFQPFVQVDDSPDRRFEGIGLGLALARELARLLCGEVGVESAPGKGSHFWLALCLAEGKPAEPPLPVTPDEPIARTDLPTPTRLDALISQAEATEPAIAAPSPENLRATLAQLEKLLSACDTRAGELLEQAAPGLRPCLGEHIETLRELIAVFDYDHALALLRATRSKTR
ncbi:MAG: histidine kinase [bacterium]|nr:MAG: histidine kinase [bacterium]KAF0148387.1 MAG: histidine kinase [bacterium]KAF0166052.1 MAG: histidine kinase [bacterium]TXT20195.1 MAG: histidine kinase [bacterium]